MKTLFKSMINIFHITFILCFIIIPIFTPIKYLKKGSIFIAPLINYIMVDIWWLST